MYSVIQKFNNTWITTKVTGVDCGWQDDYRQTIAEFDEKEFISLRLIIVEMRNHYVSYSCWAHISALFHVMFHKILNSQIQLEVMFLLKRIIRVPLKHWKL